MQVCVRASWIKRHCIGSTSCVTSTPYCSQSKTHRLLHFGITAERGLQQTSSQDTRPLCSSSGTLSQTRPHSDNDSVLNCPYHERNLLLWLRCCTTPHCVHIKRSVHPDNAVSVGHCPPRVRKPSHDVADACTMAANRHSKDQLGARLLHAFSSF
jgi:hypothetical protein